MPSTLNDGGFLVQPTNYKNLLFYKKSLVLYDMTYFFVGRYLAKGDRTVDQMVQAARSGKQNIAEGLEDALTSQEMAIKLLNVARSSLKELLEDYEDHLRTHALPVWNKEHPRYEAVKRYCYDHAEPEDYSPFFERWTPEEFCNTALTLLHQADRGMLNYIRRLEEAFLQHGGIKEQMAAARRRSRGF